MNSDITKTGRGSGPGLVSTEDVPISLNMLLKRPPVKIIAGKLGRVLMISMIFVFSSMSFKQQNEPAEKIYRAFVDQKMEMWEEAITVLDKRYKQSGSTSILYELVLARYGYIGYNLGIENKEKAKEHISLAENHIDKLIDSPEYESSAYALQAALYAYRISISPLMAVFWGRKTMNLIDKAIETDSLNPSAWIEHGNAMFYAPPALGGSKEEAIKSYGRAAGLLEKNMPDIHRWLYLNTLVGLAKSYQETGNISMALLVYQKALDFEPEFKWVKEKLMPEIIKEKPL